MNLKNTIADWEDVLVDYRNQSVSLAIGVFNTEGKLLDANSAMCFFLGTNLNESNPVNSFVNPDFSSLAKKSDPSELIFEGLLTIGNYRDINYTLASKIVRHENNLLVFAEANVPDLFRENSKMSALNQEVNNLQRQLIKEKRKLQTTLEELKETQQMLVHSEKMNAMGQLVAGVAHELNNPISFVTSNIHSLEDYTNDFIQSFSEIDKVLNEKASSEIQKLIRNIYDEKEIDFLIEDIPDLIKESKTGVERIKKIVEDLRNFSRLDEAEIKEIDLIDSIQSTIAISRSEMLKKNVKFSFNSSNQLFIECYPGQLNQAFLNLLINAVQAVEKDGEIILTVQDNSNDVIISLKDNGCGIPESIKNKIFNPFFTTKPVGTGTGLGLSITYKIIRELHKGTIRVESEEGKGTTFFIEIPKTIFKK